MAAKHAFHSRDTYMNKRISMEQRWKKYKTERKKIDRERIHCTEQMVL